jgi:hypothetical protein
MLKHIDDIRKSARERANRRWKNWQTTKDFKAAQQQASEGAAKQVKLLEPADVLEQEKLIKEATTKFESRFLKDLREMMEGDKQRTLQLYALSLQAKKKRLLAEKLRRLQLAQQQGETI